MDWSFYKNCILEPAVIYSGSDNQLSKLSETDKTEVATSVQIDFQQSLRNRFALVNTSSVNTLRIRVTLTGVETNTMVLSALTKVTPIGLVSNGIKSFNGEQGRLSGSVTYAVEVYDSASGKLLRAYVTKQYPRAESITSSFGSLDAAEAGAQNGAAILVQQIQLK